MHQGMHAHNARTRRPICCVAWRDMSLQLLLLRVIPCGALLLCYHAHKDMRLTWTRYFPLLCAAAARVVPSS